MRTTHILLLLVILFISGCKNDQEYPTDKDLHLRTKTPQVKKDLAEIKKDGVLKAITVYSETSYFLYRGQPMGFEYELVKRLADHLGLEVEIIIAQNINDLITMLNEGEGDIIAHGLTITKERKKYIDFTDYLYLTRQVLVQRKPENWRQKKLHEIQKELVSDAIELIGDTVSVRMNSSYHYRLKNLEKEIGGEIFIDTIAGKVSTGEIIKKVVDKEIKYTVADNNIAEIVASYYPILDVETPISFSQRIGWAVRNNSPVLYDTVNTWVKQIKKQTDYYVIYNNYFKNKRSFRARETSAFYSKNTGKISKYDDIIKKYAANIGWDWRFVSSLIYQESQFNPEAHSWAQAQGLMQLMPATAKELGVEDMTNPEDNIRGGTKYLNQLWEQWENIPDSIQRLKFTLASYNCGYYHVIDAQKLAEKYNDDPMKWDENVESYILKLSYPDYYNDKVVKYGYVRGIEPVTYVKQIFNRFEHYKKLISLSWSNVEQYITMRNGEKVKVPYEIGADILLKYSQPEKSELSLKIGQLIREVRLKSGLTQQDLALKSGTSRTYVSRIENDRSDLEVATLRKIIETGLGRKLDISIK